MAESTVSLDSIRRSAVTGVVDLLGLSQVRCRCVGRKKHCAPTPSLYGLLMSASFHNADTRTHRRLMLVGLMFCGAFVVISFSAGEQPENHYGLLKADKLVRTAGTPPPAN